MMANGYRISFASNKFAFEFNNGVYACTCVLSHVPLFVTPWTRLQGFSVYGIFQSKILEWVALSYSRGSS